MVCSNLPIDYNGPLTSEVKKGDDVEDQNHEEGHDEPDAAKPHAGTNLRSLVPGGGAEIPTMWCSLRVFGIIV